MTFEPGVLIEPFDEDAWAVVKIPVEGDESYIWISFICRVTQSNLNFDV